MLRRCIRLLAQDAVLVAKGPSTPAAAYSTDACDRIILKGLVFHGYHGVLPEERSLGQKFIIDATLSTSLQKAGLSDTLEDTINYAAVYKDIQEIVEGKPALLIENVAEKVAQRILDTYSAVHMAQVRVMKPHVAVAGVVEGLGVEITRIRNN